MAHWVDAPPRRSWVLSRAPRLTTAVVIALVVGAVIVTVTLIRQKAQTDSFADPILTLCAQGGETGDRLVAAGLCTKAAVSKVDPVATQPTELTSEQSDQVQAMLKSELARQKPPAPVGPTTAQLSAAVQAFIAANPTFFKAPAPTAEQIQTAVNAYMRAHPVQPPAVPVPAYQMPGLGGFTSDYPSLPQPLRPGGRRFSSR
jgi:hypothetical protein